MVHTGKKSLKQLVYSTFWMSIGAFLASFSLTVFLLPNEIIDGGVVGVAMLIAKVLDSKSLLYPLVVILNIPFIYLAAKQISRTMVIQMLIAVFLFAGFGFFISQSDLQIFQAYKGELLEIVVIGGLILGLGVGIIIRAGGCLDGTEILALLINQKYSISVGNVVLALNSLLFIVAGFVFEDWHPPIQSLITFFVVIKIMDMVIMGIDEMKSIMIFSAVPKQVAELLVHEMGIGLTVLKGEGGYTGQQRDILFLMAERLQLSEIKNLVYQEDPNAFIAIENIHEVTSNNLKNITNKQS